MFRGLKRLQRPLWPIIRLGIWIVNWPRWVRLSALGLLVILSCLGSYRAYDWYHKRTVSRAIQAEWQKFSQEAFGKANTDTLIACLDRILELKPDEALALKRKQAFQSGEGSLDDPAMIRLIMRIHMISNRMDDAAREAEKWLQVDSEDRMARCVLAQQAILKGDKEKTQRLLDALSQVSPTEAIEPVSLMLSVNLLRFANRDFSAVRDVMTRRLLPIMSRDFSSLNPMIQSSLLGCYAVILGNPELPSGASRHWVPVTRLFERAMTRAAEKGELPILTRIGESCEGLLSGLKRLEETGQISAEDLVSLEKDQEERTQRLWKIILKLQPESIDAHLGLIRSQVRTGKLQEALVSLNEARQACQDHPRIIDIYSRIHVGLGRAPQALETVWEIAERHPEELSYWLLAVDTARLASRRDRAIEACKHARKLAPARADIAAMEAMLWVEAGRAREAMTIISQLEENEILRTPEATKAVIQACLMADKSERSDQLLLRIRKLDSVEFWLAALEGVLAAAPDWERARLAEEWSKEMLQRWPTNVPAVKARSLACVRLLELGPAEWDSKAIQKAEKACEIAAVMAPDDLDVAARLAWVRLRGLEQPLRALSATAPLQAKSRTLSPDQAEILGKVLIANDRARDAVQLLEPFTSRLETHSGCRIVLAQAYHSLGRSNQARETLANVAEMPLTRQQRQDFQTIYERLHRPVLDR